MYLKMNKMLVNHFRAKMVSVVSSLIMLNTMTAFCQVVIEMTPMGNVYSLPGKVNGLELNFIFDTGASDVSLSMTEAIFMIKNGYLIEDDFTGVSYSQIANGDIVENTTVLLREVEIGGIKLLNVKASISHTLGAPLLLGQSAIQKLGPIQLSGNKLIIQNGKNFKSDEEAWDSYYKAFQEVEAGNYVSVISICNEALEYAEDNNLKSLLYEQLAAAYYNSGQKDLAIDCCHKGLGENPMNEQLGYNLGVYLYEAGDMERAERAFLQQVSKFDKIEPVSANMRAWTYAYLADIQYSKGEYVNAETNYKKSLAVVANSKAYLGLGDIYMAQEKYLDAANFYEKGISYEPGRLSNIKRYNQLGIAYYFAGQPDDARMAFQNSNRTYADNAELIDRAMETGDVNIQNRYLDLFFCSVNSTTWLARLAQSPQECISNYTSVMQLPYMKETLQPQDFITLASSYRSLKDAYKEREVLEEANRLFPDNVDVLFCLSVLSPNDYNSIIELSMKILEYEYKVRPQTFDYATVYYHIAWAYCNLGQYEEGVSFAEKSVALAPENGNAWETLGELYFYTEKYNDCINAMTKCISDTDIDEAQYKRALAFRGKSLIKMGKKKEGKKDLKMMESL